MTSKYIKSNPAPLRVNAKQALVAATIHAAVRLLLEHACLEEQLSHMILEERLDQTHVSLFLHCLLMVFLLLKNRHHCNERLILAFHAYINEHRANLLTNFQPIPRRHTVVHDDQLVLRQVTTPPRPLLDLAEHFGVLACDLALVAKLLDEALDRESIERAVITEQNARLTLTISLFLPLFTIRNA